MAELYVVFSRTGTLMGKAIRFFTKNTYNHVSISLDDSLLQLYSFARIHRCSPFVGGFVTETPSRYLCEKNPAQIKVCRYTMEDEKYNRLVSLISFMQRHQKIYIYNSFGALSSVFGRSIKLPKTYTCLEFSADALKIDRIKNIKQLENLLKDDIIYCGSYFQYLYNHGISPVVDFGDEYFDQYGKLRICQDTMEHFFRLLKRI